MNLREGTRRLALVLGGLGAIAGGVLSYVYLQPILHQRDLHNSFERFANSDVVKEQRKILQSPDPFASIAKPIPPPPSGYAIDPKTGEPIDPYAAIAKPLPSEVNKGGIATINWSHDYGVASIETTEGETLSPTPAPARWQYLLGALLPVLGFLIPWGAIRAIGWVITGFVYPSK